MVISGDEMRKPPWAIVTGGSSGFGLSIVKALVHAGYHVLLGSRNYKGGEIARERILMQLGDEALGRMEVVELDMADHSSIRRFVDLVEVNRYFIVMLINNAAVWAPAAGSKTLSGLDLSFGVNYVGPFLLTNLLIPIFRRQRCESRIINIGCTEYEKCKEINLAFVRHQAESINAPGSLRVTVDWARGLASMNSGSRCNPYVKVNFKQETHATRVIKNSTNPVWSESFTYHDVDDLVGSVEFIVMDRGPFGSDIEIGSASIPLSGLASTGTTTNDSSMTIELPLVTTGTRNQKNAKTGEQFVGGISMRRNSIVRDATSGDDVPTENVEISGACTSFLVTKKINLLRYSRRRIVIDAGRKQLRNETVHRRIRKQFPFEQILNVKFVSGSDTKVLVCFIPRDLKLHGHVIPGGQRGYSLEFDNVRQRDFFVRTLSRHVLSTITFKNGRYLYKVMKNLNVAERDIRSLIVDIVERKVYLIDSYAEEVDDAVLRDAFSTGSDGGGAKGFHLAYVQSLVSTDRRNPLQLGIWFQNGMRWQVEFVELDQRKQFERIVRPFLPVPPQGRLHVTILHTSPLTRQGPGAVHLPPWAKDGWDTSLPPDDPAAAPGAGWSPAMASAHSKLCLTSFTGELGRRLAAARVPVQCQLVDPGLLRTTMWRNALGLGKTARRLAVLWSSRYGIAPDRAAAMLLEVVAPPESGGAGERLRGNGLYIMLARDGARAVNVPLPEAGDAGEGSKTKTDVGGRCCCGQGAARHPSAAASDIVASRRLWDLTVQMVGHSFEEEYKALLAP